MLSFNTDCERFVMHDDAPVHEEEISSDLGQASSDLMTSGQVLCSNLGSTSPVILPAATQSDETPSAPAELNLRLDDDNADRTGLVESITCKPVSLSLTDDAHPVGSSAKTSLDNLDDDDPYIHSDDLLQVLNDLELAHGDECSDHSEIKMSEAEPPNENPSKSLVNRDIGSPVEDPVSPSMEELNLNSGATLAHDKQSLFGLPTSEKETLYQNPFFPVIALESDKLQHSSGFAVGVSGHPVAIPFQFPIMVNESKGQYNYLLLDSNQIQNPLLTLPVASMGMPPQGFIVAPEGEVIQNSNPCAPIPSAAYAVLGHNSIPPQEKSTQPPYQLMMETTPDDKSLKQSMSNVVSMDRPPHGHAVASEGEMELNSNPGPTIPPAECAVSGHDSLSPQEKLTQPPSQLLMEHSSDDKTLLQFVTNVVSMNSSNSHIVSSEGEMEQSSNPDPPTPPVECAVPGPGHDFISSHENPTKPPSQLMSETSSEFKTLLQSISNVEGEQGLLPISFMSPPNMESMEPNQSFLPFEGGMEMSLDTSDNEPHQFNHSSQAFYPRIQIITSLFLFVH
ncbi:hypothetical protein JHK85_032307 [Glycine max]|nr:hypothetical protein JHK85_032307 [Glycine max]